MILLRSCKTLGLTTFSYYRVSCIDLQIISLVRELQCSWLAQLFTIPPCVLNKHDCVTLCRRSSQGERQMVDNGLHYYNNEYKNCGCLRGLCYSPVVSNLFLAASRIADFFIFESRLHFMVPQFFVSDFYFVYPRPSFVDGR